MDTIGFDLGGTHIRAGVVSPEGRVLEADTRPLGDPGDGEGIVARMVEMGKDLLSRRPAGVLGIGAAGPLDHRRGCMYSPPNIPGLSGMALASRIQEGVGLPTFLENDANAAVFGEFRAGAGRGAEVLLGLTLGTGVGGGIVLGGELLRGPDGAAGELGHTVVNPDGPPCACGGMGCLEMYASATATVRRYRQGFGKDSLPSPVGEGKSGGERTAEEIFALAQGGDPFAREVLAETGTWLGIGIASMVNIFNPDVVVLLGGLSGAFSAFAPAMEEAFLARGIPPSRDRVRIVRGLHPEDAGMIGAGLLALSRWMKGEGKPPRS
ncbi:MAG: ROK family protein [Planctomycetota bacterium]|jgi:glucokinase